MVSGLWCFFLSFIFIELYVAAVKYFSLSGLYRVEFVSLIYCDGHESITTESTKMFHHPFHTCPCFVRSHSVDCFRWAAVSLVFDPRTFSLDLSILETIKHFTFVFQWIDPHVMRIVLDKCEKVLCSS